MREKLPWFIFELSLKFVFSLNFVGFFCFFLQFELLYLCLVICSQSICRCSNASKNKRDNGCQYVMEKIVEVVYILAVSFATAYGTEERKSVRYYSGCQHPPIMLFSWELGVSLPQSHHVCLTSLQREYILFPIYYPGQLFPFSPFA